MKPSSRIALRYLRPRRWNFISIIGLLSMIGIAIGTAALIVVMSIFNGFRSVANDVMIGFGPHLRIVPSKGAVLDDTSRILAMSRRAGTSIPVATTRVVLQRDGITAVAQAQGLPPATVPEGVASRMIAGRFIVHPAQPDEAPGLVIGIGLVEKLQTFIGDTVMVLSPEMIEQALTTLMPPSGRRAIVRGVFQANSMREIDNAMVMTSDALVHRLSRRADVNAIDMTIAHPLEAVAVAKVLQQDIGGSVQVLTWQDLNKGLFDTMQLERVGSFIVLALIIVVAAFNILVTLTLGVSEKRRDIAVLKTLGVTDADVARIFRLQGLMIGAVSVVIGTAIGVALVLGQKAFSWVAFDMSAGYLVPALPVELHGADVLETAVTALLLATLAAVYPARRAAGAVIADGIRVD
ncbi:MAG: FtsX-like permease family protein [Candidatus Kapabacteria bacterium]|nr:FtsX-like permease family protein [Candidatus Kapabacteria bacterium]